MNKPNDGGPAFPACERPGYTSGISLRDYFAAQALGAALLPGRTAQELAEECYILADAMLAEREKERG